MLAALQHWVTAPTFEDQIKTDHARVIYRILVVALAFSVLVTVLSLMFTYQRTFNMAFNIIVLVETVWNMVLVRRGAVKLAAWWLVLAVFVLTTFLNVGGTGIFGVYSIFYVLSISVAAVLIGSRASWMLVAMSTGAVCLLALDWGNSGVIFADPNAGQVRAIFYAITYTMAFVLTTVLIHYAAKRVQTTFHELQRREQELRQRNEALEHEIQERKRIEQQLREAKQHELALALERKRVTFLREFMSHMTHDLKTPLATIVTSLYLLQKQPSASQIYNTRIQEEIRRLSTMIDNILAVARLDNIPELQLETTSLNLLIEKIDEQLRTVAQEKRLMFEVALDDALDAVQVDTHEMHRALANIVQNAIKYTPEGGCVTVRTFQDEMHVCVEVTDTGIGIEPQDLPHIFEQYFRTERAHKQYQGTGLGLAIARKVIELHQGKILVKSSIGQGTTFTVLLPATAEAQMLVS
ncbi:MAG: hypothetical protein OHK0046_16930 [Anaerolineae bacterium]